MTSPLKYLSIYELTNDLKELLWMETTNANQLQLIDEIVAELKRRGYKPAL